MPVPLRHAQMLSMEPALAEQCGPHVDTPLLQLRPQSCGFFHLELWPFINPRAHELPPGGGGGAAGGARYSALEFSSDLKEAWGSLLSVIARQAGGPTFQQTLALAYYLLLQVPRHPQSPQHQTDCRAYTTHCREKGGVGGSACCAITGISVNQLGARWHSAETGLMALCD